MYTRTIYLKNELDIEERRATTRISYEIQIYSGASSGGEGGSWWVLNIRGKIASILGLYAMPRSLGFILHLR